VYFVYFTVYLSPLSVVCVSVCCVCVCCLSTVLHFDAKYTIYTVNHKNVAVYF